MTEEGLEGGSGAERAREEGDPGAGTDGPAVESSRWPSRWILLLVIASAILVADQLTKFWAVDQLTRATRYPPAITLSQKVEVFLHKHELERMRAEPVVIHPQHLRLRYVENPGAAWGMLGGLEDRVRIPFFYVVSLLALAFLTFLFSRLRREQRLLAATFALILGGALGNFIDRILRGYVIDFIDVHWRYQHHFPTFNVADVAISLGLIGLFLEAIFGHRTERAKEVGQPRAAIEGSPPAPEPERQADADVPDALEAADEEARMEAPAEARGGEEVRGLEQGSAPEASAGAAGRQPAADEERGDDR